MASARSGQPKTTTAPVLGPWVRLPRPPLLAGRSRAGLPSDLTAISSTAWASGSPGQASAHAQGGATSATIEPVPVCCPLPDQCADVGSHRRHDGRGNSGLQRFRALSHCQAGWPVSLAPMLTAFCQMPRANWIRFVSSVRSPCWRGFRGSGAETPAGREYRPCVAPVGAQACQIVRPVACSRAAMIVCRSQPAKQVTTSPPS